VVFKAKLKEQIVAVKMFRISQFVEEKNFSEFEKELKISSSIRHPNIVNFFGACLDYPKIAIVMVCKRIFNFFNFLIKFFF
jgi:serine/threonine protein kinase